MIRVLLLQLGEQNIHGRLKFLVVLSGLRCVDELQQREEVLFFRLRLVPDVPDQGAVQKALGLDPKIFRGFFPVAFGIGDDDIDQFEDVFLRPDVGEGVVFHALFEVDGVEDLNAVRLIDDLPAGVPHGLSVLVQLGGAPPQHGPHLGQKLSFGIGDHIGTVHLHEGGFDEKTGLAAAAAADDQDVFVPGVLGIFGATGHGEFFRLGQRDVPVSDRIDIGGNIRRSAP